MMNKTEMRSYRSLVAQSWTASAILLSVQLQRYRKNIIGSSCASLAHCFIAGMLIHTMFEVVLVGHSFGGTVLYALPAHPRYDITKMGLVMTLAAPITAPPLMMDEKMVSFYSSMHETWRKRNDELDHVGIVSYSGGLKDYQVPDHLAPVPENDRAIHRPSWSIRGVDTSADHLCILWCNQLVR
ncbi:unnamed protein product [Cylicostephanus goldi]|uniref:GPI inositol-deacylase n=1 Tax=Cylicostephanus goldi TaxID=71465 RepID=A0A3P7N260_CYLGO|nr:unnamed protein product [Cylicostephanus goldi]